MSISFPKMPKLWGQPPQTELCQSLQKRCVCTGPERIGWVVGGRGFLGNKSCLTVHYYSGSNVFESFFRMLQRGWEVKSYERLAELEKERIETNLHKELRAVENDWALMGVALRNESPGRLPKNVLAYSASHFFSSSARTIRFHDS